MDDVVVQRKPLQSYANLTMGFVAQNVAVGFTFGCFGLLIEPVTRELGGSRSLISFAVGLISLVFGLLGPMTGVLLDRWSVSKTMFIGGLIGAAGFFIAARAADVTTFILAFGVLVGAGFTLCGVLPATKLANVWFPKSLGRATGFVNVPLLNGIGPPLFAYLLATSDWRFLLQGFAWVFIGVAILALWVTVPKRRPEGPVGPAPAGSAARGKPPYQYRVFWVVSLAKGMLMSSGIVIITHLFSYSVDNGIGREQASLLLSIFGVASALGALLYGWLCDRLTPFAAMLINGALQALFWVLILLYPKFITLAIIAGGMGLCTGGVSAVALTLLGRAMPADIFGAAIGQVMFVMIPFTFFAAPLAGALYDWRGNYLPAFCLEAFICLLTVIFLFRFRKTLRTAD